MNEYTPPKLLRIDGDLFYVMRVLIEMRNIFYQMKKELTDILEKEHGKMSNS